MNHSDVTQFIVTGWPNWCYEPNKELCHYKSSNTSQQTNHFKNIGLSYIKAAVLKWITTGPLTSAGGCCLVIKVLVCYRVLVRLSNSAWNLLSNGKIRGLRPVTYQSEECIRAVVTWKCFIVKYCAKVAELIPNWPRILNTLKASVCFKEVLVRLSWQLGMGECLCLIIFVTFVTAQIDSTW